MPQKIFKKLLKVSFRQKISGIVKFTHRWLGGRGGFDGTTHECYTLSMTRIVWCVEVSSSDTQESPPAWTQEAYRPRVTSTPCTVLSHGRRGTPSLAGGGAGTPSLAGDTPRQGTTSLGRDLWPVTSVPPGKEMGPVEVLDLWDGDGVWTDRHLWKQYLPVVLRTWVVKTLRQSFINLKRIFPAFNTYLKFLLFSCGVQHWVTPTNECETSPLNIYSSHMFSDSYPDSMQQICR